MRDYQGGLTACTTCDESSKGISIMTEIDEDNRPKILIFFIVILFGVFIMFFASGFISAQTKSEVTNWLRKYVYLYELPNTYPKQVLLKVQADFIWHSLLLTERGDYWYQLSPGSEQQFSAFAQAMLGVKVEYNEIPTNIKTVNLIWAFREAINAPKGSGPFGGLAMGYFVEKFQRGPFSTLLVDDIALELINITKILEIEAQTPNNKKLLAIFGLEKANATVSDFEQMKQDKTLIKGEPAFQDMYFQQIQSWQPKKEATEPDADVAVSSVKVILMIASFFIIVNVGISWMVYYLLQRTGCY